MFDLSKRILQARKEQAVGLVAKAIVAGEMMRHTAKESMRAGDRTGHDLAITARLALEDLREHLEARAK